MRGVDTTIHGTWMWRWKLCLGAIVLVMLWWVARDANFGGVKTSNKCFRYIPTIFHQHWLVFFFLCVGYFSISVAISAHCQKSYRIYFTTHTVFVGMIFVHTNKNIETRLLSLLWCCSYCCCCRCCCCCCGCWGCCCSMGSIPILLLAIVSNALVLV